MMWIEFPECLRSLWFYALESSIVSEGCIRISEKLINTFSISPCTQFVRGKEIPRGATALWAAFPFHTTIRSDLYLLLSYEERYRDCMAWLYEGKIKDFFNSERLGYLTNEGRKIDTLECPQGIDLKDIWKKWNACMSGGG